MPSSRSRTPGRATGPGKGAAGRRRSGGSGSAATLGALGEFALIDRIAALVRRTGPTRGVVLGIGDDAAVLRVRAGEDVVVSTDCTVEDVHFDWQHDPPGVVGRRAVAAAISDLAAMGARPLACTVALCAPPGLRLARLDPLLRGLVVQAGGCGAPLVGGNVSAAGETSLSVTVLGAVARGKALRRAGARAGDALFVTGQLGRAALARRRAERLGRAVRWIPPSRLAAGRALAALAGAGRALRVACIDLSDGLAADLSHLLSPRAPGAVIDAAALPRPRGFERACREVGLDPLHALVSAGEDYELLFALGGASLDETALGRRLGTPVRRIGQLVHEPGVQGIPQGGWRHF